MQIDLSMNCVAQFLHLCLCLECFSKWLECFSNVGKGSHLLSSGSRGKVLARPLCVTSQHELEALRDGLYWAPYF